MQTIAAPTDYPATVGEQRTNILRSGIGGTLVDTEWPARQATKRITYIELKI